MDEQLIKNQSKNTGIHHTDKSHIRVIPASQVPVNFGNEQCRKENEQIWVAKEQRKSNTVKASIRTDQQQVYQENFPRISINFDKSVQKVNANNVRNDRPPGNIPNLPKTNPLVAPTPYTVVQTYADRLRYNQAKCDVSITLATPEITTKQGLPVVLYVKEEVMKDLAATSKYTLIGKFSNTMPKVELIRNNFILQTQLSGGVKIAHFNSRHVYIDLDNELDYNMVWTKQRMSIAGQVIIIQVWTPNFKPAEETPIVPIWISLPELPWHCYNKDFVSGLLSPIGKVLYLDSASIKKTRGSRARVKVQVDLTEKRPPYIWMGYVGEDITDGRWQKIEYDNIPDYCFYCKHQGHLESDCTIRQRDDDKKKNELENKSSPSLEVLDKYKGNKSDSRPQTTAAQRQVQVEYNRKSANIGQDNINRPVQEDKSPAQLLEVWMGRVRRHLLTCRKGSPKEGGDLTYVRHEEVDSDPSGDYRAPATPITNQQQTGTQQVTDTGQKQGRFNNKSGDRLSKTKREAIKNRLQHSMGKESEVIAANKQIEEPFSHQDQNMTNIAKQVVNKGNKAKVIPDDYGVLNSEDDLDHDNQSMDGSDEDGEDTKKHTDQVVVSTYRDKYSDVQRMTEQQGLSPRGRK
ncbi:hypothetical protein KY290_027474 [Solanum tuberosum]|uniref:CCHC-type domain-containing protein n=1 Tax=Solanum tuberosum TaxID=4113 RepID=A0ABQ7UF79_SOLTU|nr:hypothetical protein KY285_029057 [Solanum tuberosum]KAH0748242.1 hypothetical protein KY290_027474 [Solanum tuberosum]